MTSFAYLVLANLGLVNDVCFLMRIIADLSSGGKSKLCERNMTAPPLPVESAADGFFFKNNVKSLKLRLLGFRQKLQKIERIRRERRTTKSRHTSSVLLVI